jgi:hypothetical protein
MARISLLIVVSAVLLSSCGGPTRTQVVVVQVTAPPPTATPTATPPASDTATPAENPTDVEATRQALYLIATEGAIRRSTEDAAATQTQLVTTPTATLTLTPTPSPTTTPTSTLTRTATLGAMFRSKGDGTYYVGDSIGVGLWLSGKNFENCYWETFNANGNIIRNFFGNSAAGQRVYLSESIYGVEFDGCGRWTWQGQ